MLSFGGCLQEPEQILRYVLDECLSVWINENWENLELYHMKNNAAIFSKNWATLNVINLRGNSQI